MNSVIAAAAVRANLSGVEVLGIHDGFQWLMQGDTRHVTRLGRAEVSRIHFRGGSFLGTSRANPSRDPKNLQATLHSLIKLNVDKLLTIGGDGTAFSAFKLHEAAKGKLSVVHVPKTIDNDLDLPPEVDTFGFQTARHVGVDIVKNLMVDAKTTRRWYLVVTMGRKAGHLALGIGKAAGATVTLVPEEFPQGVALQRIVDTLVGTIIKRLSDDRPDGVAVIAEGLLERLRAEDLATIDTGERDQHANLILGEMNFAAVLKQHVRVALRGFGLSTNVVAKTVGYELRCADPTPFDMEYTRDLGYCGSRYLIEGGSGVMVSMQGGRFVPIPFEQLIDSGSGRARVRLLDIDSDRYRIARTYMVRLRRDDFDDALELARLAETVKLTPEEFRARFEYVTEGEPSPMPLFSRLPPKP